MVLAELRSRYDEICSTSSVGKDIRDMTVSDEVFKSEHWMKAQSEMSGKPRKAGKLMLTIALSSIGNRACT